jgi:hypothetical protein
MSRKLEKFISDNRNEFDDALPSAKVWENLAAGLQDKGRSKFILTPLFKWSLAAALMLTAGTAIYFFMNAKKTNETVIAVNTKDTGTENMIAPEVNEFVKLVALKQEELKALAPEQPELYQQFTEDINQLDSSYTSLKNQLSLSPNREMLIEAMVQNLQLQLNVLNQQLNIINQIKESKKYSHEKDSKSI